jgi:hypothetical protein
VWTQVTVSGWSTTSTHFFITMQGLQQGVTQQGVTQHGRQQCDQPQQR